MITSILLAVVSIAFGVYIYKFPPTKPIIPSEPSDSICMNYSENKASELSRALIHEMAHGYRNNQLKLINDKFTTNKEDKEDAHSIWFDLETIKNFIYHIEINAKKNNITSDKLGFRIYYSRYPEMNTWKTLYPDLLDFIGTEREKYERLHTLVMIPTIHVKNEKTGESYNVDFNPKDINTYTTGLPEVVGDVPPAVRIPALGGMFKNISNGSANQASRSTSTLAQNHGSLIPPEDDPGERI